MIVALAGACAPAQRPPTFRVEQTFHPAALEPERLVSPGARAAMADARTIAFVPPASCREVEVMAADDVEAPVPDDGLGCASLMSRLEAGAVAHGFEVVSWQSLDGPSRAIDYARELGVDVLFEVNEAGFGIASSDLYDDVETRVFDDATNTPVVLRDGTTVANRCIPGFEPALQQAATVVLDVKMVTVSDGKVQWAYRAVSSPLQPGAAPTLVERYTSSATSYRPKGRAGWKIGVGAPSMAVSIVAGILSIVFDTAGEADIPHLLYLAEAALLGTGIYMIATAEADAYWEYQPADDVVCVPGSRLGPPLASNNGAGCDSACEARKARFDQATSALMAELLALRADRR